MKSRVVPDFVIAGAAKSGTTSLYHYLDAHPDIFMSRIKEPNFFLSQEEKKNIRPSLKHLMKSLDVEKHVRNKTGKAFHAAYLDDEDLYRKLFEDAPEHSLTGEASVSYLYSHHAPLALYRFNPEAKIILMLRNPVERAFSHYLMDLHLGFTSLDFEKAFEADRQAPVKTWNAASNYIETGLYSEQVKRFLETFPAGQVLILFYDEFRVNPEPVLAEVFEFLGVNNNMGSPPLQRHNESLQPRIQVFRKAAGWKRLRFGLRKLLSAPLRDKLKGIFFSKENLPVPDERVKKKLSVYFADDIEKLEKMTGKDLSSWKKI